jgi:polar amino acid transport system permease protein
MSRDFEWPEFVFLLMGLRWTVALSLVAFLLGGVAGLGIALLRTARAAPLRWLAAGYVGLFQGTPLLMQLFLAYFGLAVLLGVRLDPWPAVALAFTLYAAAFLGEIWRGAIEAIPRGQWEAAQALALPRRVALRRVVLPQAFRIAIPPTVGFLVQLVKGTSVAAIIGFVELTRAGQLMVNVTFQPMTVYPLVAVMYFALCWPLSLLALRLARRIDAGGEVELPSRGAPALRAPAATIPRNPSPPRRS